ncbi:MAG: phage minor capsid protein [Christensenellaceae bacterium]|jgi:hypothetical protein
MLSPEQIFSIPAYVVRLYREFEDYILADISERIARAGKVGSYSEWQMTRLAELNEANYFLQRAIDTLGEVSIERTVELLESAANISSLSDGTVFALLGMEAPTLADSATMRQIVYGIIGQTSGEIANITNTLGFKLPNSPFLGVMEAYQRTLDSAVLEVLTGATDYNTAIKRAVKRLCDAGLSTVLYDSGRTNKIDVAARRAIMTGASQISGQISEMNMQLLGTDYVEVSAHAGARPDHADWQGKVYKMHGAEAGYPNLEEATGYGTGEGLMGWNCRHSFSPFLVGLSKRNYSSRQLKAIDPPAFTYQGRKYTAYEATQQQRRMETMMRQTKREVVGYKAAGLADEFTTASVKLRRQRELYKEFSSAAGLYEQSARTQVIGFDRSVSSLSTWAARKAKEKIAV